MERSQHRENGKVEETPLMKAGQKMRDYAQVHRFGATIATSIEVLLTQGGSLIYEPERRAPTIEKALRTFLGEHLGLRVLIDCSRNGSANDPLIITQVAEARAILLDLAKVDSAESVANEFLAKLPSG